MLPVAVHVPVEGSKLPRLAKKLRVMASWTLDIFFGQEIEQMLTVRLCAQVGKLLLPTIQSEETRL
jgi:hypothetical protein